MSRWVVFANVSKLLGYLESGYFEGDGGVL